MTRILTAFLLMCFILPAQAQERKRAREYGVKIGVLSPGKLNAITDVMGVQVGHLTLIQGQNVRTGVTAILPHGGNLFQDKVPAAVFVGNGFGKLAGSTQVKELGNLETPIILTTTLAVGTAMNAVIDYTLGLPGNEKIQSVNALVGETNDGGLNDSRGRHITVDHVQQAIRAATSGPVAEGNVGAGTGTVCFGFKGGIGTSSRVLPTSLGKYTVGVLVQTNFGGVLLIDGAPVGEELGQFSFRKQVLENADGSCMMVVATDAPLDARNLERLASRAMLGLAKTGGIASNGSGDYVIAFSTHTGARVAYSPKTPVSQIPVLHNDELSALFLATIEATEEAIINSLFKAQTMTGHNNRQIQALPLQETLKILKKHHVLQP